MRGGHPRVALLVFAGAWLSGAGPAWGETEVSGTLDGDHHWVVADAPYLLTADVTVAPDATLLIDPGVEVVVDVDLAGEGQDPGRIEVVVQGGLRAPGTEEEPIWFRPFAEGEAGRSAWAGLCLDEAGEVVLDHVRLEGARIGLDVRAGSLPAGWAGGAFTRCDTALRWASDGSLDLSGVVITGDCDTAVHVAVPGGGTRDMASVRDSTLAGSLLVEGTDTVIVLDNTIRDAWAGGLQVLGAGVASVEDNDLGLGAGIVVEGAGPTTVARNTVASCAGLGIDVAAGMATVASNEVSNCGGGIAVEQAAGALVRVLHNTVVRSRADGGVVLRGAEAAANVTIQANISVHGRGAGLVLASGTEGAAVEHNDVWDNADNTIAPGGPRAGNLGANPHFVLLPAVAPPAPPSELMETNLRLSEHSPLLDLAPPIEGLATDHDGRERSYDGDFDGEPRPDIGAHEYRLNRTPRAVAGEDQQIWLGEEVHLDGSASEDPDGEIRWWRWSFGDGTEPGSEPAVTHLYAAESPQEGFQATLTVRDDDGAEDSDTLRVRVTVRPDNVPPVADAGGHREVWVGVPVVFDGSASHDPDEDGWIESWHWEFGDGASADGEVVEHTFQEVQEYRVALRVTDDRGGEDEDVVSVAAWERPENELPVADAGGDRQGFVGETLVFDGSASRDPDEDGRIESWHWDFGDGASADGELAEHVWEAPGDYAVVLTVTDDRAGEGTDTAQVQIEVRPDAGSADGGPGDAGVPDAGEPDTGGPDTAVPDIGQPPGEDAGSEDAGSEDAGSEDGGGVPAPDSGPPLGNLSPVADPGPSLGGAVGVPLDFDGSLSRDPDGELVSWLWDFGDGTGAVGLRTYHTYVEAGTYTVRLTVRDDDGAEDSATTAAEITRLPPAGAGAGEGGGCACGVLPRAPAGGLVLPALGLLRLGLLRRRGRRGVALALLLLLGSVGCSQVSKVEGPFPTTMGTAGGACFTNGTCNEGLRCRAGVCEAIPVGADGGACRGDGSCDEGLSCQGSVCGPALDAGGGRPDVGPADSGPREDAARDAAPADVGRDTGPPDAGEPDVVVPTDVRDAGPAEDTGGGTDVAPDTGPADTGPPPEPCTVPEGGAADCLPCVPGTDPGCGCGDDMVPVVVEGGGAYCIDTFEASEGGDGHAVSEAERLPWLGRTWDEARFGCQLTGKRLCTPAEWERACAGDECPPVDDLLPEACLPEGWQGAAPAGCALDGLPAARQTGTGGCTSPCGAYDLIGNAAEYTADAAPDAEHTVFGGAFSDDNWRLFDCRAGRELLEEERTWSRGGGLPWPFAGFRCCKTPGLRP